MIVSYVAPNSSRSSKELVQRAKMLKSLANDYLTESRSLLHEAALVAEEEARNRNQWAEKARKHAYKLERIVIK